MKPCTLLGLTGLLFILVGCGQEGDQPGRVLNTAHPPQIEAEAFFQAAKETALESGTIVDRLKRAVAAFIEQPDQANLEVCRDAWLQLHNLFLGLDYFFYDALKSKELHALAFNIHAWPLAPGFIDSLPEYPAGGIVSDLTLNLSKATLRGQQAATSSEDIILGLHAVEYLLWQRPLADFQPVFELSEQQMKDGLLIQDLINNRRRRVLELITEILTDDLHSLGALLVSGQESSVELAINNPISSIRRALDNAGYELKLLKSADYQAHSEFSQSSLQNIQFRLQIIQNSLSGTTNLATVLSSMNRPLADAIQQTLAIALSETTNLQANDSERLERLLAAINLLNRHMGEAEQLFARKASQ